jgi:hypothetical protein
MEMMRQTITSAMAPCACGFKGWMAQMRSTTHTHALSHAHNEHSPIRTAIAPLGCTCTVYYDCCKCRVCLCVMLMDCEHRSTALWSFQEPPRSSFSTQVAGRFWESLRPRRMVHCCALLSVVVLIHKWAYYCSVLWSLALASCGCSSLARCCHVLLRCAVLGLCLGMRIL